MIRDAHDANELAFALGALAHYVTDTTGHPQAVNPSVPLIFPKLAAKFGNNITYVEAPKQHVITEFSFDIVQAPAERTNLTRIAGSSAFASPNRFSSEPSSRRMASRSRMCSRAKTGRSRAYRYASQPRSFLHSPEAAWRDKQDEIRVTHAEPAATRIYLQLPADRF